MDRKERYIQLTVNMIVKEAEEALTKRREELDLPVVEGRFTPRMFIYLNPYFYTNMCDQLAVPDEYRDIIIERSQKCVAFFLQ